VGKCHITGVAGISHMVISHDKSHDECGKVVYRPRSNCISSIQKVIGTLLSSPCQLRLRG